MRRGVHLGKPLRRKFRHAAHPLIIRAKDNILACAFRHVPVKQCVQSVSLIESAPECLKILLALVAHGFALCMGNAASVSRQARLARKRRENILRRRKDAADYCLAEGNLGRDIAVEKFICHVSPIVQVADSRGGQTQNGHIRIHRKQAFHPQAPHSGAAAVKFVQDYIIRIDGGKFALRHVEQLGICEKGDVRRRDAAVCFLHIFNLRGKDVFRRREPAYAFIGVIIAQPESYERLARSRGVYHSGFFLCTQQFKRIFICDRIMTVQFYWHAKHLTEMIYNIIRIML